MLATRAGLGARFTKKMSRMAEPSSDVDSATLKPGKLSVRERRPECRNRPRSPAPEGGPVSFGIAAHRAAPWTKEDREARANQCDANGHDHGRRLPGHLGDMVGGLRRQLLSPLLDLEKS